MTQRVSWGYAWHHPHLERTPISNTADILARNGAPTAVGFGKRAAGAWREAALCRCMARMAKPESAGWHGWRM